MSAPRPRKPGELSPSRAAALYYLQQQGRVSLREAGAMFGVSGMGAHDALTRIRRDAARVVWPEDELTC